MSPSRPLRRGTGRSRAAARGLALALIAVLAGAATAQDAAAPPPILESIEISGNDRTGDDIVRRVIGIRVGEPFPLDQFDAAWDRLEDCGYFAFVDLDYEEEDGRLALFVEVEEEKTARFTPLIRYSRRHKYLLGGAFRDRNFGGRGEELWFDIVAYRIQRARGGWHKPWLFGADPLAVDVTASWEQANFVFRPFDYTTFRADADLRWDLLASFPLFFEAGGGWLSFDQQDPYSWAAAPRGGSAAPPVVDHPAATRGSWRLRAALGYDSRANPYYPQSGVFARVGAERLLSGDFPNVTLGTGEARIFLDAPGRLIVALHGHGRAASGPLPIEERVFYGGPETVRGAPYAQREGENGYLLSAELRYPLFLMPVTMTGENVGFGVHAFYDAGDAWHDGADAGRSLQSFGGGVHLNLFTWQLRFEAAKERDHGWMFEFMDEFNF